MAVFKKLIRSAKRILQALRETHARVALPSAQGKAACLHRLQAEDSLAPSKRSTPSTLIAPVAIKVSWPALAAGDDRDYEPSDEDSHATRIESTSQSIPVRYEADMVTWGTPLQLLHISEECLEVLLGFNLETIEDLVEHSSQILRHPRLGAEMRFEIESQLAEWRSHVKQLTKYAYGEEELPELRPAHRLLLDQDGFSTFSDLDEVPVPEKWPRYLPDSPRNILEESSCAHCYTCDIPFDVLQSLLEDRKEVPVALAIEKISDVCEAECMYFDAADVRYTDDHIRAHIRLLDDHWVIKGGTICLDVQSASKIQESSSNHGHLPKREGRSPVVSCDLLIASEETVGTASVVDQVNDRTPWTGSKKTTAEPDAPPDTATSPFPLDSEGAKTLTPGSNLPMPEDDRLGPFCDRPAADQLRGVPGDTNAFEELKHGGDDLAGRLEKVTVQELINALPEPLSSFLRYLTTNNNSSYKLVLAYLFLKEMDEKGHVPLSRLRIGMYEYYRARKEKGLVVEAEGLTAARVDAFDRSEFQNRVMKNPLCSFLNSRFFLINKTNLCLATEIYHKIYILNLLYPIVIILEKSIDSYYKLVSANSCPGHLYIESTIAVKNQSEIHLVRELNQDTKYKYISNESLPEKTTISIKRKKRSKIQI